MFMRHALTISQHSQEEWIWDLCVCSHVPQGAWDPQLKTDGGGAGKGPLVHVLHKCLGPFPPRPDPPPSDRLKAPTVFSL